MTCERSITFVIPGDSTAPGVQVKAVENDGALIFTVDVQDDASRIADLRALFFHLKNETKLAGLTYSGGGSLITELQASANQVINLGNGANLNGAVKGGFDVGLEFGHEGIGSGKFDINGPVTFTLSNTANNLTLDDIANTQFGARLTSVGDPGGARSDSAKLTFVAPAAPDARADAYNIFEDGQSGLTSPSHTPAGVLLQVLANDTDADGNILTITAIDTDDLPQHGSVQIVDGNDADTAVGDAILYTPNSDYAGLDDFTYCISDGAGGTDFAKVSMDVAAVADVPVLDYEILEGATVNEIRIRVTATQTDADSSEFIDRIVLSGLPDGVSVSEASVNPAGEPDQLVHEFVLTLPPDTDINFDLGVTAVSKETSNGDEEIATASIPIVLEHTLTNTDATFLAVDESIWSTGDQFTFTDDRFLGINESWNSSSSGFVFGATNGHIKAGFQSTLNFEGGEIDASVPYDITVESSYNKTTDVLFLTADASLGAASFTTEGPEGSYTLDFIFDFLMRISAGVDPGAISLPGDPLTVFDVTIDPDFLPAEVNILDVTSDDLEVQVPLPAGFSLTFAWPDIDTTGGPSASPVTANGASNNFLELGLDVDELLFTLLSIPNPFDIGFDLPLDIASFHVEAIDLDLSAGLNFLQQFAMTVHSLTGLITFEDGLSQTFDFDTDITLENASIHDTNNDGKIDYTLELAPNVDLANSTDLGFNFGYEFDALKASGSAFGSDFSVGPIFSAADTIPITDVEIFNDTFALAFQNQNLSFMA